MTKKRFSKKRKQKIKESYLKELDRDIINLNLPEIDLISDRAIDFYSDEALKLIFGKDRKK